MKIGHPDSSTGLPQVLQANEGTCSELAETGHDPFIQHITKFYIHNYSRFRHHVTYSADEKSLKQPISE